MHTQTMRKATTNISVRHKLRESLTTLAEALIWTGCNYASVLLRGADTARPFTWSTLFGWGLLFLVLAKRLVPNNAYSRTARRDEVVAQAMKTALFVSILALASFTERTSLQIYSILFFFCALSVERLILNSWFIRYSLHHCEHGVLICNEETMWQQALQQNTYGLKLARLEEQTALQLGAFLAEHPETESVYCSPSVIPATEMEAIAHLCHKHGIVLHLLPWPVFALSQTTQSECRGTVNVLSPAKQPLHSILNRIVKRLTDIVLSLLVLLTVFPVFALVAFICIKKQSRGPVIISRHMCGMDGKTFQCYTFRTRHYEAAPSFLDGINDPGHFTFGKFLMLSRLELLPQFLCVLWGSMTIVGSQLMRPERYTDYRRELEHCLVSDCRLKAGITSYRPTAQAKGSAKADAWYLRNWGFWLDLRIMFQRLGTLLSKSKAKSINYI